MNLLLVTNVFPNRYEPTKGTFNLELVRALAREHRVSVVSPVAWTTALRTRPTRRSVEMPSGVDVEHVPYYYTPRVLRRYYGSFLWYSTRARLAAAVRRRRPDVVIGYWLHPDGEVALRAAQTAGAAAVMLVGGSDALLLPRSGARRRRIVSVLQRADGVVAVSDHLARSIVAMGVSAEKVATLRRGVDLDAFAPGNRQLARRRLELPSDIPIALWVGRMVPVKRLDLLLEVASHLRARGFSFLIILAGTGPLERSLQSAAEARGLSSVVRFVGRVAHRDLPDWYRAADVTVLPSDSEGMPNALLESIAVGTPFVATRVGGIPEIADARLDSLIEAGDDRALADALQDRLMHARELPAGLRAIPIGWPAAAKRFSDIARACLSRRCAGDVLPVSSLAEQQGVA